MTKIFFSDVTDDSTLRKIADNESIHHGKCRLPSVVNKSGGRYLDVHIATKSTAALEVDNLAGEFPAKWTHAILRNFVGNGTAHVIGAFQEIVDGKTMHSNFCGYLILDNINDEETIIRSAFVHPAINQEARIMAGMLDACASAEWVLEKIVATVDGKSQSQAERNAHDWYRYGFFAAGMIAWGVKEFEIKMVRVTA